jgi:hypothetical protein
MSKKTDKLDEKIKLLTAVRNNKPAVATDETEKPDFKKPLNTYTKIQTASSDAQSIKGVPVDDSDIEDGKSLVYSGKAQKIVYSRVRHSGGVAGAGTGDMTKTVYDTDADNVVESADDADTLDGVHAAGFLQGTWTAGSCAGTNPITKAHGLGGTPSIVLCLPNALQPYVVSYNADATNIIFYHNAAASLTIKYLARL